MAGKSQYNMKYTFKAYDFNNTAAREHWIGRVTDAVATGHVDGAFIDGNRGGFNSGITGPCNKDKRAAWAVGLEQARARRSFYRLPQREVETSSWMEGDQHPSAASRTKQDAHIQLSDPRGS